MRASFDEPTRCKKSIWRHFFIRKQNNQTSASYNQHQLLMVAHNKTPAQKEKDKLNKREVRARQAKALASASTARQKRAAKMRELRAANKTKSQGTISSVPRRHGPSNLFGSDTSARYTFSFGKESQANGQIPVTPTPNNHVSAPQTAPPAIGMTSTQQYNLEIARMQKAMYTDTSSDISRLVETLALSGTDKLRQNCADGITTLGTFIDKSETVQE